MSPILVRPVREQFEHDRVIRVLQARYKRKFEVAINPGAEQNASITIGDLPMFPDLVLFTAERGARLQGTIEVETTESINTLEAMAEWAPFSKLRTPFFLYVPPNALDTVKRLCAEHQVVATEIWTYHTAADQVRFTMVHKEPETPASKSKALPKIEVKFAAPAPPKPVAPKVDVDDSEVPAVLKALKAMPIRPVQAKAVAGKPTPVKPAPVKPAPIKAAPAKAAAAVIANVADKADKVVTPAPAKPPAPVAATAAKTKLGKAVPAAKPSAKTAPVAKAKPAAKAKAAKPAAAAKKPGKAKPSKAVKTKPATKKPAKAKSKRR